MEFALAAVIARDELLRGASRHVRAARVVPLGQGLSLMPMTDSLFDSLRDIRNAPRTCWEFSRLPIGFDKRLARWSAAGPVAYVEAHLYPGGGSQGVVVWSDGTVVLGPLDVWEGVVIGPSDSPVSRGLRRLGVVAEPDKDEIATVGLGRHRNTEGWISQELPAG
ncbi:hypothetical protein [Streptomyces sp. NPDC048639]|uniref:hypothetical protein n=1 Tax=Streptomyces sp. NPDC048639 TaxID=3365581 RepID=UPI00370F8572